MHKCAGNVLFRSAWQWGDESDEFNDLMIQILNLEEYGPIQMLIIYFKVYALVYFSCSHFEFVHFWDMSANEPRRSELHSSVNTSIAAKTALQVSSLAKDGRFTLHSYSYGIPMEFLVRPAQ